MTLSKLRVVLEASVGGFNRAIRSSGRVLGSMLNGVKSLTTGLFSLGAAFKVMLAVMAVRRLAMVAKSIFDMGAAVAETQSMFETVFGAGSKSVQAFIDDFANMAGASSLAAQEMLATTAQIVQGMGITQAASADLATEVLKLAADWASFKNLRIDDTLLRINAAITGERESLKRLGVVILVVDVQQRVMHDNRLTSIKDITQEMKVLATLALIQEKSGVVLGDLVRTQNSAANRAKQLGAAWLDLRNTAAAILQPAFISILDAVAGSEVSFANWSITLKENAATIVGWSAVGLKAFQSFGASAKLFATTFKEVMGFITEFIRNNWRWTMAQMEARFLKMVNTISVNMLVVTNLELDMIEAFNRAINAFNDAARDAEAAFTPMTLTLGSTIEQVGRLDNELVKFTKDFANRISEATQSGTEAFEGFFQSVLAGFARLAAELAIFQALTNLFPNSQFVSALGKSMGIAATGGSGGASLGPTLTGSETGFSGPLPARSSAAPVFNQNVNFNISTVDARGVDAVLRQQAGTIVAVVAEAAQSSSALRRTLGGG